MVVTGLATEAAAFIVDPTVDQRLQLAVMTMAGQVVIIGVLLMCYQALFKRTDSNQELYRIGYDNGYEDCDENYRSKQRPVVVDLSARRCSNCGTPKERAVTSVLVNDGV